MIPVCDMRGQCSSPSKGYIPNLSLMIQNARKKLNNAFKVIWKNNFEHEISYTIELNQLKKISD